MNTHRRWVWAGLLLSGALTAALAGEVKAVVKSDRVNVRGQATLRSEVVTQLRQGEEVVVVEEIVHKEPKRGDPAKWAKIRLPVNTPVWVFAPYIEPDKGTVNVSRVNLRAGPGENFSVLGRLERGVAVKQIRVDKNWMEVEAPESVYAYVASEYLEIPAPAPTPEPAPRPGATPTTAATAPPPAEAPPTTTQAVETPLPVAPVTDVAQTPAPATEPSTPTAAAAPTETTPAPDTSARRVVSREGRVILSRSIQAPTDYALESAETRRTINYLHSENLGVNLRVYAGRKVIVSGEELIDRRWTNTPIIEVENIRLVP